MTTSIGDKNIEADKPHWIEWLAGAGSAFIVLFVIAWIGKDALMDQDSSPDLVGKALQTERRSGGFQVAFEIRNDASATASQVTVQGVVHDGTVILETAETVLDYVPGHSKAKGGFVFRTDPSGKAVTIRATAYSEP